MKPWKFKFLFLRLLSGSQRFQDGNALKLIFYSAHIQAYKNTSHSERGLSRFCENKREKLKVFSAIKRVKIFQRQINLEKS